MERWFTKPFIESGKAEPTRRRLLSDDPLGWAGGWRAIAALETAARLAPNSVQTWFTLARAYQRAGRADDVKRARENFVKLDAALRAEREKTRGVAAQPPSLEPEPPPE